MFFYIFRSSNKKIEIDLLKEKKHLVGGTSHQGRDPAYTGSVMSNCPN